MLRGPKTLPNTHTTGTHTCNTLPFSPDSLNSDQSKLHIQRGDRGLSSNGRMAACVCRSVEHSSERLQLLRYRLVWRWPATHCQSQQGMQYSLYSEILSEEVWPSPQYESVYEMAIFLHRT